MTDQVSLSNEERRVAERKVWRRGIIASLVVHIGILGFFLRGTPESPFAAAGPRAGDNRAAAGGMQTVNVRVPPPRPIIPPRIPLPMVADVEPIEIVQDVEIEVSSILGERPGDDGPGVEEGDGEGDGGTAAEGSFRMIPPSPRGMIIPPPNKNVKGQEVQIWVWVNEAGRVVGDSTRLRPPTSDGDFNRRLLREASEWIFEPARRGGRAIAAWFPYTLSM